MAADKRYQEAIEIEAGNRAADMEELREAVEASIESLTYAIELMSKRLEECEGMIATVSNQITFQSSDTQVEAAAMERAARSVTKRAIRRGL